MSALGQTAELAVLLRLKDEITGPLNRVDRELSHLNTKSATVASGFTKIGAGLALGAERVAVGIVGLSAVATGLLVKSTKMAGEFEAQLNTINTIAQQTPVELSKIGRGILDLSDEGGADLGDLTGAYYDLLSAGIKVSDAQGNLELAFKLSRGALSSTGEAVDFLTTAINAYQLSQSETIVVADQFAQAVADGKVKMSEISATFANVASVAKSAGIDLDEIAAAYGNLTAQGVPAAEVTTEMNRAILDLIKPSATLVDLQKKMHTNYATLAADKGLVVALQQMRVDAEKAGIPFQDLFGRIEGYKFALQTTGPANAAFVAELDRIRNSGGALQAQFDERQQGLNFQFSRTKAIAKDLAITLGTELLPAIDVPLTKLNAYLSSDQAQKGAKDLGEAIAGAFSEQNIARAEKFANEVIPNLQKFASEVLPPLVDGLKMTGAIAKQAFDMFNALPAPAKSAIIAALAANKLSGGLISSGLSDLTRVAAGRGGSSGGGIALAGGAAASPGMLSVAVSSIVPVAIAAGSIAMLANQFEQFVRDVTNGQQSLDMKITAWKDTTTTLNENVDSLTAGVKAYRDNTSNPIGDLLTNYMYDKQTGDALVAAGDKIAAGTEVTSEGIKALSDAVDVARHMYDQKNTDANKAVLDQLIKDLEAAKTKPLVTPEAAAGHALQAQQNALADASSQKLIVEKTAADIARQKNYDQGQRTAATLTGGGLYRTAGAMEAADSIASMYTSGQSHDYRAMAADIKLLTQLQAAANKNGDKSVAATIARDIEAIKTSLATPQGFNGLKGQHYADMEPQPINVSVNVEISAKDFAQKASVLRHYNSQMQAI